MECWPPVSILSLVAIMKQLQNDQTDERRGGGTDEQEILDGHCEDTPGWCYWKLLNCITLQVNDHCFLLLILNFQIVAFKVLRK